MLLLKMIAQSLLGSAVSGVLLLLPAGTWRWPQAWAFMALFAVCGLAIGVWLLKTDPDLLAERLKPPTSGGQRGTDKGIVLVLLCVFVAWLVVMGLDERWGWSDTPPPVQAVGAALVVASFGGIASVLAANRYASPTVRVQEERRQTVVSTGPYAVVRHPMYAYALLLMTGAPLLLGLLWGLAGLFAFVPLLAARIGGEEQVLRLGLPGYEAYALKVRRRLIPGFW